MKDKNLETAFLYCTKHTMRQHINLAFLMYLIIELNVLSL